MNTIFVSGTDRQYQILQLVEQRQRISVAELCELFSISEATARRDLETLATQGRVQRVHGGAIALQKAPPELPILERETEEADAKRRIGLAASELVQDGETIFLGSGTTVLEVAKAMRGRKGLTVLTNSLPVINALADAEGVSMIVLGGLLRQSELSFIGHITEQALAEVRADKVFIGTRAIDPEEGLSNHYLPETLTDRAILRAGREVIVVADHSKFGRVATARLAPIATVQVIVTDSGAPEDMLAEFRQRGVNVIVA